MQNQKIKDKKKRALYIKNETKVYINFGSSFLKTSRLSSTTQRGLNLNRIVNRCGVTFRNRGVFRKYKLARGTFRRLASFGYIPGVQKSSW